MSKYLKTCALLWTERVDPSTQVARSSESHAEEEWPLGELGCTTMITGKNFEVYQNALARRGYASSGDNKGWVGTASSSGAYPTWKPYGTGILDFASMFDVVFLANAPPYNVIEAIKARSNRNTKIGLCYFNFESVNQGGNRNAWFDEFDEALVGGGPSLLTGTGVPAGAPSGWPAGVTAVDQYEDTVFGNAGNNYGFSTVAGGYRAPGAPAYLDAVYGTPHTWMINLSTQGVPALTGSGWFGAVHDKLNERYPKGLIDYILVDNMAPTRVIGQADNYSAGNDSNYVTSYRVAATGMQNYIANGTHVEIAGNGTGWATRRVPNRYPPSAYSDPFLTTDQLHARYGEHFFRPDGVPTGVNPEAWYTPPDGSNPPKGILAGLDAIRDGGLTAFLSSGISTVTSTFHSGGRALHERWIFNNPAYTALSIAKATDQEKYERGPGGDYGNWDLLLRAVQERKLIDKVYIMNARTSGTFGIFYDEVFGPVW